MTCVTYAHDGADLGGKFSDCHKCHGWGSITTGAIGGHTVSEPCRRCNPTGMGGDWSEKQQRYVSPDVALMERTHAKHGSPDDYLFGEHAQERWNRCRELDTASYSRPSQPLNRHTLEAAE